jgi:hypothetical protein
MLHPTPYLGLYTKAHELPWHLYGIIRTSPGEAPINRRHRAVFGAKSHHPMAFSARTLRPFSKVRSFGSFKTNDQLRSMPAVE